MNDQSNLPRLRKLARAKRELLTRIERCLYEGSLSEFVAAGWSSIENVPYERNWAIEALCEHLQAVTEGYISRLLVNFPPRCAKSNVASIMWPAWVWARSEHNYLSGPGVRFLTASYGDKLAIELAGKFRALVGSPWYNRYWGDRVQLKRAGLETIETLAKGGRRSTSVGGSLIGLGGDVIIVDDPHNTEQAESETERETTLRWWREISNTRLNDPRRTPIVVIMQRLHQADIAGTILEGDEEGQRWVWLNIPMEYDPDRHCVTGWIAKDRKPHYWQDPRKERGELMWQERFSRATLTATARELGPYMYSGRYQQDPVPDGGGIIKAAWWQPWKAKQWPVFDYLLASLDTSFTEKQENDPSAMTVWGVFLDEHGRRRVMLVDAWSEHLEFYRLVEKAAKTCKSLKVDRLLIEAKANGISVAQELRRLHSREPWSVDTIDPKSADKIARVHSVVPLFADDVVFAPTDRDWAMLVIKQCTAFPKGAHDDLVDTVSQALRYLRDMGLAETGAESQAALTESLRYRSPRSMRLPYVA